MAAGDDVRYISLSLQVELRFRVIRSTNYLEKRKFQDFKIY